MAHAAASMLASLVAPPLCGLCRSRCGWREALCGNCRHALIGAPAFESPIDGLDAVLSACPYEGAARALVGALKFAGRLTLASEAAQVIAAKAPSSLLAGEVVPVPPSPWRIRLRGLDPAEEIAYALARVCGLPFSACLARSPGPRQVGRPRAQRLSDPPRMRLVDRVPSSVLLVDDVLTTGSTLRACALELRRGGARKVVGLTFARTAAGLSASSVSVTGLGSAVEQA